MLHKKKQKKTDSIEINARYSARRIHANFIVARKNFLESHLRHTEKNKREQKRYSKNAIERA